MRIIRLNLRFYETSSRGWRAAEPGNQKIRLIFDSPKGSAVIVCRASFPQPRLRKVSDLGVARFAGHPYAVHKLPRSLHHK